MKKIRVLCVDDSALVRHVLTEIVNEQPDMEVVGAAADPYVARELIKTHAPDVLTLDVEMPRMDGLDFLEKLMRLRPMPVVMVSSLTQKGSDAALRALELGAVDCVEKPRLAVREGLTQYSDLLAQKIRAAAMSRPARLRRSLVSQEVAPVLPEPVAALHASDKLIAIGASTGGTEAIREVLTRLPSNSPPIVIGQHMPPGFTHSFAQRLDRLCRVRVKEAEHGETLQPGHAYIAPGDFHLTVRRSGMTYVAQVDQAPPVNRHRPSIDVLFDSVARSVGRNAIGMILTGMGRDGAAGLLRMRRAGAHTLAQDEASCVVYGMPREAVALEATDEVVPLAEIAGRVLAHLRSSALKGSRSNNSLEKT